MRPAALSLLWTILALMPTPHLRESLKALLFLFLTGHGKARPQHSKTKSPSALSRFLNRYPWPTRALIRLARKEAEKALDRARKKKGPKPRLLVVLDLVTLEKRGRFQALPLSFFHGKWGLHLVVLYLVYGDLRVPWAYRLWRGKGEKGLSLLALSLLASLPLWMRRAFRIRVAADAAFGTAWFLSGVRRLGFAAVVGMRRDRRLRGGGRLSDLRRQGSQVYLWGLSFPVWVAWYRYPLPQGGWEWRYVVATRRHAPDHAHLGKEAVHGGALLPGCEERVLPGAVRAADGLGGAPLSGPLPSGLPAGLLGGDGGEGELAGGQGGGSPGSLARAGGAGHPAGAPRPGSGAARGRG
ncbi:hypothetical protein TthSNM66_23900 (plasmid) [Thermus thermophilus]|nr:hypothetical protein TthSNM66_23900 [Thermus thermophilus]